MKLLPTILAGLGLGLNCSSRCSWVETANKVDLAVTGSHSNIALVGVKKTCTVLEHFKATNSHFFKEKITQFRNLNFRFIVLIPFNGLVPRGYSF